MLTQTVAFGSVNARGLIDLQYSKPGTSLGCPRLTVIDLRLKPLYLLNNSKHDRNHARAAELLQALQAHYVIEKSNLLALTLEIQSLIDPKDFLKPDLNANAQLLKISLHHPLSWQGLRLIKLYDDLILLVQFLYSTGLLPAAEPHKYAQKLRERAGRPVRRFLTQVSKELASAGFAS